MEATIVRGRGRPSKDQYILDESGEYLLDTEGNKQLKPILTEEDQEIPNTSPAVSSNPDVVQDLVDEVRRLRQQVQDQAPGKETISGKWDYDYSKQQHLRVHGGLEVSHPPGFLPAPPGRISMYKTEDGGTTNDLVTPIKKYLKFDGTGANPLLGEDGQPLYTNVPIGKAAARGEDGKPILTDEYKFWLHKKARGERLDSNVLSDISAGKGLPGGAIADSSVSFGDNGIPLTSD